MIQICLISIALGVWFIVSALMDWDWFYQIMEIGLVAAFFGDGAGRVICLLCGVVMVFGGIVGIILRR